MFCERKEYLVDFLDEKIAKFQKEAHIAKKYSVEKVKEQEEISKDQDESIGELTQVEITEGIKNGLLIQNEENLIFERKTFFEGKMVMPILKDFFDENVESEMKYIWSKKHVFSISLNKVDQKDEVNNIDEFTERIESFFKENKIYVELIASKEEQYKNYSKYITTLKMPTSLDYIYQYMVYFKFDDEIISLIFNCLDKNKEQWEKIMVGISELVEINDGE